MRINRLCVVVGLLAPALACRAVPSMYAAAGPANSLSGKVRVFGHLGGALDVTGAIVQLKFDAAKAAVINKDSSFTPGPGWTTWATNVIGNEAIWIGTSSGAPFHDGADIVTVRVRFLGQEPSKITLAKESTVSDQGFFTYDLGLDREITITPGDPPKPIHVPLGAAAHTGGAVMDGVAYAGTDNGKLFAYNVVDASPVQGFPVDIGAAVGKSVKITGRPAGYYGSTGKAIYLTTDKGDVVRVLPSGVVAWTSRPVPGHTNSTPAVTPDGSVYVNLGWETDAPSALNFLFQLDEVNGNALSLSPYLGKSTPDSMTDRSPTVDEHYVYVNASGDLRGGLVVLDRNNLMPRAEFAQGQDSLPPYVLGANLYLATRNGLLYSLNAVTFTPVSSFGSGGIVNVREPITTSPLAGPDGTVYVGTATGRVIAVDPSTGAATTLFDSGSNSPITGLVVNDTNLALTTKAGTFYVLAPQFPTESASASAGSEVNPGMVYDGQTDCFVFTTVAGDLCFVRGV